jgi:hypothetical protein
MFRNEPPFLRWGVVSHRSTTKLEDHPLSAVSDCLFNIFATSICLEAVSSVRNMRTRHAVMTGPI